MLRNKLIKWSNFQKKLISIWGLIATIGIASPWLNQLVEFLPPEQPMLPLLTSLIAIGCLLLSYLVSSFFSLPLNNLFQAQKKLTMGIMVLLLLFFFGVMSYFLMYSDYVKPYGKDATNVIIGDDDEYRDIVKTRVIENYMITHDNKVPDAETLMRMAERDPNKIWKNKALKRKNFILTSLYIFCVFSFTFSIGLFVLREVYLDMEDIDSSDVKKMKNQ